MGSFIPPDFDSASSSLSLAVAEEIIQAHGGTLELESTEGQGTVVTVTLPVIKEEENV